MFGTYIVSMKFWKTKQFVKNKEGYYNNPKGRGYSDMVNIAQSLQNTGDWDRVWKKFPPDLPVETSFAYKKILLLFFVKNERNGDNEFENKIIRIDPYYPKSCYTISLLSPRATVFHLKTTFRAEVLST